MSFVWPLGLLALLLVPLMAGCYAWAQARRRRFPLRYSSTLLLGAAGSGKGLRRHAAATLYLLGIAALALALARPQATLPNPEANGTIILVIDASRSMLATDIAPSRIEAAQDSVRRFVSRQPPGISIGVVAFSGGAGLLTPPTRDRKAVLSAVNSLRLGTGTNIGEGLLVALDAIAPPDEAAAGPGRQVTRAPFANPGAALLILLSDGASTTGPPPLQIARELADAGVRTYTVGLGTAQGGVSGPGRRMMQLDEATLRGIAELTGGEYFGAENAAELHEVYGKISRDHELLHRKTELTFVASGAGVLLFLAAGVAGALWGSRLP